MPKRTVLMGAAMRTPEPLLPVLRTDPLLLTPLTLLRTDRSLPRKDNTHTHTHTHTHLSVRDVSSSSPTF
jgi:hypothetical protein